jgi:hypothetical protein
MRRNVNWSHSGVGCEDTGKWPREIMSSVALAIISSSEFTGKKNAGTKVDAYPGS